MTYVTPFSMMLGADSSSSQWILRKIAYNLTGSFGRARVGQREDHLVPRG